MECTRYAIWWVPRPGTGLARFGTEWTGWCADGGTAGARRALAALSRPRAGVPGGVRLRGLHATVHAPFRLPEGRSDWALDSALSGLARDTWPIRLPRLHLTVEAGRVVLAPMRPDEAVTRLLTAVAEAVLPLQVGPGYAALMGAGTVAAGGTVLPDAGCPGALAESAAMPARFRLPLTDRLDPIAAREIIAELEPVLSSVLARSNMVADFALVGDPGHGRPWRVLERYVLDAEAVGAAARVPPGMDCRGPRLMAPLGRAAA